MTAKEVVLVVGSGRSGTSLFSMLLRELGYLVPQPEIPADATNPRGFGESQWVVGFHTKALRAAGSQVSDARPTAWADAHKVGMRAGTRAELRRFLTEQLDMADGVVVKDPRLAWFLPAWREAALDLGARPLFVTMLRHPAEVVASKSAWYGVQRGAADRVAGWLNVMLYAERATRGERRAFVRYPDLLDDWTRTVAATGQALGLELLSRAGSRQMANASQLIDTSLRRSTAEWSAYDLPAGVVALAEEVNETLDQLATEPSDPAALHRLDDQRARYADLYRHAEDLVYSSILAAERASAAAAVAKADAARRSEPVVSEPVARTNGRSAGATLAAGSARVRAVAAKGAHSLPHGLRAAIPAPVRRAVLGRLQGR